MASKRKRENRIIAAARLEKLGIGGNPFVHDQEKLVHIYTDGGYTEEPGNKIASIDVYFAPGNMLYV